MFSRCLWSHSASIAYIEEDPDEEVAARVKAKLGEERRATVPAGYCRGAGSWL